MIRQFTSSGKKKAISALALLLSILGQNGANFNLTSGIVSF